MLNMLSTQEASEAIVASMPLFSSESVATDKSVGRILRQDISAERDQPPFDRVMMDGIALQVAALSDTGRQFRIQGTQHAGDPVMTLQDARYCIEVMTGAVMPEGTDCVIPVERISVAENLATIEAGYAATHGQFVHPRASDHRAGARVLASGKTISPMDIAVIASSGLQCVEVSRTPAVRVISTGNELVPAGKPIDAHQIRLSNGPAILAMLSQYGFRDVEHEHLMDELQHLEERLGEHLADSDVLILSGGVSMGKADFVPQVLAKLGVKAVFHKITQRPGKPMWFGIGPQQQAVFALPGNPVSTLVCCHQYVVPALFHASRRSAKSPEFAVLAEATVFKPDLTCFLPVRLSSSENGAVVASPVRTNTSGDFTALSMTDGYIELARAQSEFAAGSVWPLHRWNDA